MVVSLLASAAFLSGCDNLEGPRGPAGPAGATGAAGAPGQDIPQTTVDNLQAQITAIASSQSEAESVEPESCSVCHKDVGEEMHQSIYDKYTDTSALTLTINSVTAVASATAGKFDATINFTVTKDGSTYNVTTLKSADTLDQASFYSVRYFQASRQFLNSQSFGSFTRVGDGIYTATATAMDYDPSDAANNAEVFGYIADDRLDTESGGHVIMYDSVASAAMAVGDASSASANAYVSAANVSACQKCHGTPYMKHGYRNPIVAGLPDFASCKVCHYDDRDGHDQVWQQIVDDPYGWATGATPSADYAYKAKLMNDVHMSHSMEFPYPQSPRNCATCHEGKLNMILTDANFTPETCKSCHPVNGDPDYPPPTNGTRAPSLQSLWDETQTTFHNITLTCNDCHKAGGVGPVFSALHNGYNPEIYSDGAGTYWRDIFTASVDAASFDDATSMLTVEFSATKDAADTTTTLTAADIVPTVVIGLYGYDTKHLLVSPHDRDSANIRLFEFPVDGTTTNPRFTVVDTGVAASWEVIADLSDYADMITSGVVKRLEIGVMPSLIGPVDTNWDGDADDPVALNAPSRTFDLAANAFDDTYFADVVDVAGGCNKCHDALGTTFHSGIRGGNIKMCKMCHVPKSGGSHLEMQSRSIDSYIHAIHSFQAFDSGDIDWTDPVAAAEYAQHIEHVFPNFTIKNCEACHNEGMFDVPDQSKSLPGVLSGSDTWSKDRNIGNVPSYVAGPASRACGGCHRANWIKEDEAGKLAAWNQHTKTFGYLVENASGVYDTVVDTIMSMF